MFSASISYFFDTLQNILLPEYVIHEVKVFDYTLVDCCIYLEKRVQIMVNFFIPDVLHCGLHLWL